MKQRQHDLFITVARDDSSRDFQENFDRKSLEQQTQVQLPNGPVEIVDFPIENGDFPQFFVCLPEGTSYPTVTVTIFLTYMVFIVATAVTVTISSNIANEAPICC